MSVSYEDEKKVQAAKSLGSVNVTYAKKRDVSKEEATTVASSDPILEDEYEEFYYDKSKSQVGLIRPPFDFKYLAHLIQHNNSLGQCIAAYEVNIDGTGYEIESKEKDKSEEDKENDSNIAAIKGFFDEPNPRQSIISLRREIRRDVESTGNGYLEALRSIDKELIFLRRLDAKFMRLVKLDDPVPVETTVMRGGKEKKVTMHKRERRYAMKTGSKLTFYKEYGASRELHRLTGQWEGSIGENGQKVVIDAADRATEVIHTTAVADIDTGYGVPRWITQVPSVLGSRKAEELNLDFFNAGGLPPALIVIQGGTMTPDVRKELEAYLSGKGSSMHRAAIVEAQSTSGDINSGGTVRVTVERFGSERMQDSMFENYDEKCEKRVRSSFRLPPLFVGRTDDYTFASAFASYMVAEAQVFEPERMEFDELMNVTVMKELNPDYEFRSLPMSVKNVDNQLKALEIASNKGAVDNETLIDGINEAVNLDLQFKEEEEPEPPVVVAGVPGAPGQPIAPPKPGTPAVAAGKPSPTPNPGDNVPTKAPVKPAAKADGIDTFELVEMASEFAAHITGDMVQDDRHIRDLKARVATLGKADKERFDNYVAMRTMSGFDNDPEGAVELCSHAGDLLTQ